MTPLLESGDSGLPAAFLGTAAGRWPRERHDCVRRPPNLATHSHPSHFRPVPYPACEHGHQPPTQLHLPFGGSTTSAPGIWTSRSRENKDNAIGNNSMVLRRIQLHSYYINVDMVCWEFDLQRLSASFPAC